jgi:dimethylhistidine N-methyltransferase
MTSTAVLRKDLKETTGVDQFYQDVLFGLSMDQKWLPCKYFYDDQGSRLFEQICELEEYYPTRVELSIMCDHIVEMAESLGPRCLLIEPGAGNGRKTRMLLEHMREPAGYIPIDISNMQLIAAAGRLAKSFPQLEILPVCADFMGDFDMPHPRKAEFRRAAYFPGSTIGNLMPAQAKGFLRWLAELCGMQGALLIGVDLKKDPAVLERAYADAEGVTAAFNLNLLVRMNRELHANFRIDRFRHHAFYNAALGRVEMHLISLARQEVNIGNAGFHFERDETIRTECCYKFDLDEFRALALDGGFKVRQVWQDERSYFSVQHLVVNL